MSTQPVCITDIPDLDPVPMYSEVDGATPIPEIRLPSGHIAAHLTRYEDVKRVLLDPAISRHVCNVPGGPNFLPGPTQPELLLNLDMPEHARSRALVTKDFSPKGVERLRDSVEETTLRCLHDMTNGRAEPDLFGSVLEQVPSTVVCNILGIPQADREFFRRWSKTIQVASKDEMEAIEGAVTHCFNYLMDFVRGERSADPDGFIRRYVQTRENHEDPLTDAEFVGVLLGILLGGDHNSLSVMTKIVYTLLCSPPLWGMLVDDPLMIGPLVEELIRLIPIGRISTFPRVALREVTTSLGVIPAGKPVYANVFLANRDPTVFEDPLLVIPGRAGRSHLQFGFGTHHCMGPWLARMEIGTVLSVLTREAPDLQLAVPPRQVRWVNGIVLRRPDELPVRWSEVRRQRASRPDWAETLVPS